MLAHNSLESGVKNSPIKGILGHSNLATTERYMGSFDTSKTDRTILSLFKKKVVPKERAEAQRRISKTEQAIELFKELSPEQIMAVISAINK